ERTVAVPLRVLALFRVQEHPPGTEVVVLDHLPQLVLAVDESELGTGRRMVQRLDQAFAGVVGGRVEVTLLEPGTAVRAGREPAGRAGRVRAHAHRVRGAGRRVTAGACS